MLSTRTHRQASARSRRSRAARARKRKRAAELERKIAEARAIEETALELLGAEIAAYVGGLRPSGRGWKGVAGGEAVVVQDADKFRATTVQVCGFYPFIVGAGTPVVGVPMGRHLLTGATVCADPISWFQRAKLIRNPYMFVLALNGTGKSSYVRHTVTGLSAYGTIPIATADLKPDYVDLVRELGGQVISLGPGRGHLNVLDPGEAHDAAALLREHGREKEAREVLADAHDRRKTMLSSLITIQRKTEPVEREEMILDAALRYLDAHHDGIPVLADLLQVVRDAPADLREAALDGGHLDRYRQLTEDLEVSLSGLISGGRLGGIFAEQTSEPMMRDRAVVYDVSSIGEDNMDLQAAVLMACWSQSFGMINIAHVLADAGIEPRRHYFAIVDELWRALRVGRGMVDRMDALTRLNRTLGTGMAYITHTLKDADAIPSEEDRMKARGFIERAGYVVLGGLPGSEMPELNKVIPLSNAEQELLKSWQMPDEWDPYSGQASEAPGIGKFLIKIAGKPGIPLKVGLTPIEIDPSNTSSRWDLLSRSGRRKERTAA
ncbi:ATP/GTP-binding protein [Leucobacter sp. HNU]|uniref:ATP/GTP-binding protein n=1 Tax=Leucobacter sp. HNU TaxID=3236805 RepID=UPI003A80035B